MLLGLPVSRFSSDGISNVCEFFQIRPTDKTVEKKLMFGQGFNEVDIARISTTCIGTSA
jgi:hypothetical protein